MNKKFLRIFCLALSGLLLLAGLSWGADTAASPAAKPTVQFAADQILVKFKGTPKNLSVFQAIHPASEIAAALTPAANQALANIQGTPEKFYGAVGVMKVRVPPQTGIGPAIEALYRSGTVEFAEPNYRVKATGMGIGNLPQILPGVPVSPNDPSFGQQWALKNTGQAGGAAGADINATNAWSIRTNASATIVGVIGTGVDYTHLDLINNMWVNPHQGTHGYTGDKYGINAYLGTGDPKDDNGQGTHLAGIIGAQGNNARGIAGVAWTAKIMALKALDENGWGWVGDVIECINYVLAVQLTESYPRIVLCNGYGSYAYSLALYNAIKSARDSAKGGVLFVTGTGNDAVDLDQTSPFYPAGFELANIISTGASTRQDYWWPSTNRGAISEDLAAPGMDILSTWLTNTYKLSSGTAQAAAHVTGASALVWAQNSAFNWKQVKGLILNGSVDGVKTAFGRKCVTEGRLNLYNSLGTTLVGTPAIFQVMPTWADLGTTITITGINFGTVKGTISFKGYNFPPAAISSWTNEQIVAKVPGACPTDWGRLTVAITGGKTSRGAAFAVDVGTWEWCRVANTILAHQQAASAQIGNNVWIISGLTEWGQSAVVERFALDTLTGMIDPAWTIQRPVRHARAAAIGTKIYVVGGYDDVTLQWQNLLQIFDTATGTWSRGRNIPKPLAAPAVVSYGGKIYVFGGQDPNNKALNTTFIYTPATNSWATGASLPWKTAWSATAFVSASKVWLMGGKTESGGVWNPHSEVLQYDFVAGTWDFMDTLASPTWAAAGIDYKYTPYCLAGGHYDGQYYLTSDWKQKVWGPWQLYPMAGKLGNKIFLLNGDSYGGNGVYRFIPIYP